MVQPSPPLPCVKSVYMFTVCKGGGYGGLGLRQINNWRKVPLHVNFFRWRHFALPSRSVIFLRFQVSNDQSLEDQVSRWAVTDRQLQNIFTLGWNIYRLSEHHLGKANNWIFFLVKFWLQILDIEKMNKIYITVIEEGYEDFQLKSSVLLERCVVLESIYFQNLQIVKSPRQKPRRGGVPQTNKYCSCRKFPFQVTFKVFLHDDILHCLLWVLAFCGLRNLSWTCQIKKKNKKTINN